MSGARRRPASAATFSSTAPMAGSIAFATQPARRSPARSIALRREERVVEAAQPQAHDEDDGQAERHGEVPRVERRAQGHEEPAHALDDGEVRLRRPGAGAPRPGLPGRSSRPSRAAAMCGAIASRSSTGVIASDAGAPVPAACASASVSSLAQRAVAQDRARRHGLHRRDAQPPRAQGMHQRAGDERLAHAGVGAGHEHAVAHRGTFGEKPTTCRPSARRFGGTFQA